MAFVGLFDQFNISKLPIFKMDLIFDDEKMDFYPSFHDLEETVLEMLNLITNTMQVRKYELLCFSGNVLSKCIPTPLIRFDLHAHV